MWHFVKLCCFMRGFLASAKHFIRSRAESKLLWGVFSTASRQIYAVSFVFLEGFLLHDSLDVLVAHRTGMTLL